MKFRNAHVQAFDKEVTRDNRNCDFNILQLSLLIGIRLFLLREYLGNFRSHTFPFHSELSSSGPGQVPGQVQQVQGLRQNVLARAIH